MEFRPFAYILTTITVISYGAVQLVHTLNQLFSYKRNALESLVKRDFSNTQSLSLVTTRFSLLIRYMTITVQNVCSNVTIIMFISKTFHIKYIAKKIVSHYLF